MSKQEKDTVRIKSMKIRRFKSIEHAELHFGGLNIFVGANASGKSNLFEAFRFLQGLAFGLTIDEIFHGKEQSSTNFRWEGIRGGSEEAVFRPLIAKRGTKNKKEENSFEIEVEVEKTSRLHGIIRRFPDYIIESVAIYRYSILVNSDKCQIISERLQRIKPEGKLQDLFSSSISYPNQMTIAVECDDDILTTLKEIAIEERYKTDKVLLKGVNKHISFLSLIELYKNDGDVNAFALFGPDDIRTTLNNFQDILPDTDILRDYSYSSKAERLGRRGENFASLVKTILKNKESKEAYIDWLRKLTPTEIDSVTILKGAVNDSMFAIKQNGKTQAAHVLSDGTLRFAALTAALFEPDAPTALFMEEVENGIHPSRLKLLLDLLESRTERGFSQLFVTTHSPVLLAWLKEEQYKHTFLCARDDNGASRIQSIESIPHVAEVVRKRSLGELFSEEWLEFAL